ncbi:MAG TPA: bifunctional [glutamate--ammonia ligase]-adenylyl-L-tyrosine phosphorylase/[glutamate--ammonia-ligase] adenylyltransferase [Methylomirabilota bacterium]|jgi:glutamate-ammonia-ligase adenylyltransferase|nr:bifunctional [glutamate--ammonia ligase]-adenylyl-L-tyrosine phosphorylase/[glutamate--ammonia-ligase] adenylyltransferase [Methylomirabilota bacterium]
MSPETLPFPPTADLLDPAVPEPTGLPALAELGFADPIGALRNLRRLAEGPRQRELLAAVLPRLLRHLGAAADPDMALNNLERLAAVVMDRVVLYTLLSDHPDAMQVLVTLAATSQFLADTLVRSPQIVPWLLDPRVMEPRPREAMREEIAGAGRPFRTEEGRANALRRVKRRELCRIGLRDILGDADLVTTTQELSNLADACLEQAWAIVEPGLTARFGIPQHGPGLPTAFAIIGLGKLGGEELNYSSDIDLCFVYEAEGETAGPEVVQNRVFFARAAERILAVLTTMTEEGAVYRVDLRLRPEGTGGPLALPLAGYRQYHETRSLLWERQSLIKARLAAGDERLGRAFLEFCRGIAYRPGIEREAVSEIQAVKSRIDRLLRARGRHERHVKLGVGGIREIEFHIQALQLLYGAQDPWLQERNSLRALHRLAERGYLSWEESGRLARAYRFLRTVEHRLQLLHALQTHTLPGDAVELGKLARRLGYAGDYATAGARFLADYDATRRGVRAAFEEFFEAPPLRAPGPPPSDGRALQAVGFADPERARQNLRLLWEGPPLVPAPQAVRTVLATLLPAVLEALRGVPDPDGALNALERFVAAAGPRTAYLARLAQDGALLRRVLTLFVRSDRLAQSLITRPELLDELADPASLTRRPASRLRAAFAAFEPPGLDAPDRLRLFKQAEELRIGWQDVAGTLSGPAVSWALTELAEACLGLAWDWAETEAMGRFGEPVAAGAPVPALVVGMGKLGGRELDYGSDLDVVVLYAADGQTKGPEVVPAHVYFDWLIDRLFALLTAITRTGQTFRVDLRLRQGGKGTALAHSLASLDLYLEREAALWERQAMVKARPVRGDRALARAFQAIRRARVFAPGLSEAERAEIHRVRMRMEVELGRERPGRTHVKFGAGGLVDIEFLTQVLQLTHGARHGALRTPSTRRALRRLGDFGLLPADTVEALLAAYEFQKGLLRSLRLAQARPPDCLPAAGQLLARLAREAGLESGRALLERYRDVAGQVRTHYLTAVRRA